MTEPRTAPVEPIEKRVRRLERADRVLTTTLTALAVSTLVAARERGLRALGVAAALAALTFSVGCAGAADESPESGSPETFRVQFQTSSGPFEVEFVREWSPLAVDRVHELAQNGFWDGARIYRVNDRYAQFGYSGRPALDAQWIEAGIPDEPTVSNNTRGTVSFARGGPDTRSAILFINRTDNTDLDQLDWRGVLGFPPVGRVVSGMEVIDSLYDGYGDEPMQWEDSIATLGNPFLDRSYPALDSITDLRILPDGG
jgi:peptidyl-prolyl cis-trans isomerase A (cyclophilin A)